MKPPKKIPWASNKTQKTLDQNLTPKKSHAEFLSHKNFQKALRWLKPVLQAVSGSACFKSDKQTWRRKRQWYTEDDYSKSAH